MHHEAHTYVAGVAAGLDLTGCDVVEIGSYNVNGGVRGLFAAAASYTGVDLRDGPGVDVASPFAALGWRAMADVIVSTETLEHDPDLWGTLAAACAALRPGGWLIVTAAAPERRPHGVSGDALQPGEHYAGVHPDDLRMYLQALGLGAVQVRHDPRAGDVYATAWRLP